jgi:hypothetical protein
MKNRKLTKIGMLMFMIAGGLLVSQCKSSDSTPSNNAPFTISGTASGAQEVPAVSGTATGSIQGTYNPSTRTFSYTSSWTGLTGAPTSGGFYAGASGVNGVAVGTPFTFGVSPTGTGSTSGTMTLTTEQASQLTAGGWYYNYGTAAHSSGEIRGQITAMR